MTQDVQAEKASMTQSEAWTLGRLLGWTTDYLKKQGSDSPRLDAEVLLAHAKKCRRIELYTAFDEVADDELRAAYREMVRRRAEGTPVAYLVGSKEFFSLPFYVNADVLIPRPETEHLVTAAIDDAKTLLAAGRPSLNVADVCTGSGCIAVAFAKHVPAAHVTATDIDEKALEVARRNVEKHELADRVKLQQGDLLAAFPGEPAWDMILCNPPYVSQSEYDSLAAGVREHEPQRALLAGDTGLEVIERLQTQAAGALLGGGVLLLELSPMIAAAAAELFQAAGGWSDVRLIKDLAGKQRILRAVRK